MGLNKDLKLKGNNFTNAATAFFIAYLIAEIPNGISPHVRSHSSLRIETRILNQSQGIILQNFPVAKWLSANVILWGIATACTAASHNYRTLLAARIFLGIFEAAIAPSLVLISSQWYTKSEQAPRFSVWYAGLGLGQIIGGVLSYAFQQVKRDEGLEGWRIMFVVLGVVTVVIGMATGVWLPDTPMQARFLSEGEKVVLLKHVAVNRTGIRNRRFKARHILEIVLDAQMWLMTLLTILVSIVNFSSYVNTDGPCDLDLHFKRRSNNILRNPYQEFRLFLPERCSSQHAFRSRLYRQHTCRRLRHPLHLPSLGLARLLLYTRHPRRRPSLLRDPQPRRTARGHLSRQHHYRHTDHHLSVDGVECCRTDQEGGCRRARFGKFQRGEYHWPADFPGEGCTGVYSGQDHCFGDAGCCGWGCGGAVWVLCVGQSA